MKFLTNLYIALSPAECLLALAALYFVVKIVYHLVRLSRRKAPEKPRPTSDLLREGIELLSVAPECVEHEGEPIWHYTYQDAVFYLYALHKRYYKICMPNILEVAPADITPLRSAINAVNTHNCPRRIHYTIDELGRVMVHAFIVQSLPEKAETLQDDLKEAMEDLFRGREEFYHQLASYNSIARIFGVEDGEQHAATQKLTEHMVTREEARHLLPRPENCSDAHHPMQLRTLLERLCEGGIPQLKQLTVVAGEETKFLQAGPEIDTFEVLDTLIERDENGMAKPLHQHATLIITGEPEELILLTLEVANVSKDAIYVQATLCRPPAPTGNMEMVEDESLYTESLSVILGVTVQPENALITEIDYMWSEAKALVKENRLADLNEEQSYMALHSGDRGVFDSLYRGKKLEGQGRYYEALLYLESAYEMLSPDFCSMKREVRERFFELCYDIGLCYSRLKLYKEAYTYLDAVANKGNLKYTTEYVNCLVNSKDHRALNVVENLIAQSENYREDSEEPVPHEVQQFYDFLRRRKAFLLVDLNALDEAEEMLRPMLNEPDNSDFALTELAYIQNLRKENNP